MTDCLSEKWGNSKQLLNIPLCEIQNLYLTIDSIDEKDPILTKYADKDMLALMKQKYATCGLVGDYKVDYGSYIYNSNFAH